MSRKMDGQRDVVHLADWSFVSLETNVRGKNKSLEDDFLTFSEEENLNTIFFYFL